MFETIKDNFKMVLAIVLVIILTHSIFFMIYGYLVGGDPFVALKNFYNVMYNVR